MVFSKQLIVGFAATLVGWRTSRVDAGIDDYVLPSACIDMADGEHQLKLMDGDLEDAPIVTLNCDKGYTILDPSMDSNLEAYFDTFMLHHTSVAGPTNDVHPNWEGWYKADDGSSEYVISPDCSTCQEDHVRQLYKTRELRKTAYMMTGTMFGCFWNLKGEHNFDEDYDTYQCYYTSGDVNDVGESIRNELNDYSEVSEWDESGVCAFSVRESDRTVPEDAAHDTCTTDYSGLNSQGNTKYGDGDIYHLKPSIGIHGEYCVCTKPATTRYFTVPAAQVTDHEEARAGELEALAAEAALIAEEALSKQALASEEQPVFELWQKDFNPGTFRILASGTYKVMEDIVFDFNADYDAPNSDAAWWPHSDQSEDYPGAGDYHNSYFLGFWAGITVEADDVVLDLNGKTLRMSDVYYHQQRWFTTVALQAQYFLPGQGIGFFGADPHFAQNIVIRDGTLGLSSHHGIHGHFNKNVLIENVHVRDFETHGIQFNGFDGVTIRNCEVGPTSERSYFKGEYGHARTLLPRFQKVADENPTKVIHFYGRDKPTNMQEIVDELQKQTDMAYNHVVHGEQYDEDDESWISAKYLFIDSTNLPNGAAMYGIFLNTYGASVLTYNLYTSFYSTDATVEDTVVHGLRHSMTEYVRMSWPASGNLFMNPLHAPFDAAQILESLENFEPGEMRYKGSVLTDACLAMEKFTNNWNYLQAQLLIDSKMLNWAQAGGNLNAMDGAQIGCNIDVMIHSGKGINGLRIDGVDGVRISGVEMYDITEETPFGRSECGEYDSYDGTEQCVGACGGHFRQTLPMQTGFSGTMVQGINVNAAKNIVVKDVNIHDFESHHGPVFGVSVWPAVDIKFEGHIETRYLQAGTKVEKDQLTYESRPNIAPEGCGVRLYQTYTSNGFTYTTDVNLDAVDSMESSCVSSHASCFNEDNVYTHLGDFDDSAECQFQTDSALRTDSSAKKGSGRSPAKEKAKAVKDGSVLADPSMVSHANPKTTHAMFVNLLMVACALCVFAYFAYKCVSKGNLLPKTRGKELQSVDEAYSLINENDDAAKYTVL